MNDHQTPLASRQNPSDEAIRESRHEVLRELLGAYADRELPPETTAQIDAHLIGCIACRRELEVHDSLRARLASEPPAAASPALRARITAALDAAPAPQIAVVRGTADVVLVHRRITWIAIAGWVTAALLAVILGARIELDRNAVAGARPIASPVQSVPLLGGIVDDYALVSKGELPGRARDLSAVRAAVPFPIEPLRASNLRLIAAWTTTVGAEPAAVLAYRLDDRLIVQYLVAEDVFFRHPAVRAAVADRHLLTGADGSRSLVAWPGAAAGTVLIGDVPSPWLERIWSAERAR